MTPNNQELAGLTPAECFELGAEWASFLADIQEAEGEIGMLVHAGNLYRIRAMMDELGWSYRHQATSSGWIWLVVQPGVADA